MIIAFNCIALSLKDTEKRRRKKKHQNKVGMDAVMDVSGWVSEFQRAL